MRQRIGALRLPNSSTKLLNWESPSTSENSKVERMFEETSNHENDSLELDIMRCSIDDDKNDKITRGASRKKIKKPLAIEPNPVSSFIGKKESVRSSCYQGIRLWLHLTERNEDQVS